MHLLRNSATSKKWQQDKALTQILWYNNQFLVLFNKNEVNLVSGNTKLSPRAQ